MSWLSILIPSIIFLIFLSIFVLGIYFIIKYKHTKEKKYLIIGLILTLIVAGILIYIFIIAPMTAVTYGPSSQVVYGPPPMMK